jgi:acetyl esterase/lipase
MAGSNKYAIHSDFAKIPSVNLRYSPLIVAILNAISRLVRFFQKRRFDLTVTPHVIESGTGQAVDVKVLTPHNIKPNAPALVYYHGGGFALTYAAVHLKSAERYANEAGCIVVFVCYRLAMKHPFPAGFDDCYAALQWVADNAAELGIDRERVAVGGDSAGGALAAGVAQKCRDESLLPLRGQLLIYPVLDSRCVTPSAQEFTDVPLWNAVSNRRMWDMYLRSVDRQSPPAYAAPGLGDATGLPATYIETAEFDPLRDEALNYGKALRDSGNDPVMNETLGTIHGYDGVGDSEIAKASMTQRVAFLRSVFA